MPGTAPEGWSGEDRFDLLGPVFATGCSVIATAGWMLEKELSIGAEIAKFIEDRFPTIDALRESLPARRKHEVGQDATDIAGLARKVVGIAAGLLVGRVFGDIVNFTIEPLAPRARAVEEDVAVLQIPGPLLPGQTGEKALLIRNERKYATSELALASSDLICASGGRIAAHSVHFEPARVSLAKNGSAGIVVGVTIPQDTPSGSYSGTVRVGGLDHQRTALRVDVA